MTRAINPDMIVLAREAAGLSQTEVAQRLGWSQAKVSKHENGILVPDEAEIALLAKLLGVRPEFFIQQDKVYGLGSSMLFNRKRKAVTIGIQKRVQAQVNITRMQIDRLLRGAEIEQSRSFVKLDVDEYDGDVEEIAAQVRLAWRVPTGPIPNMTELVESAGGVVLCCDFGTEHIDAAHLWVPGLPPMFFMNQAFPTDRYRFTLAHELGHAIMHEHAVGEIEEQADAFASAFLMPADEIADQLRDLTLEKAARLKLHWRVSIQALVRRAADLGVIDEDRKTYLYKRISMLGYRRNEPMPLPPERSQLVAQLIDLHRSTLGMQPSDIGRLLMSDAPPMISLNHLGGGSSHGVGPSLRLTDYRERQAL